MSDKVTLPNSKEAEDAIVGAMLTHPEEVVDKVLLQLTADDFYHSANKKIVQTIEELKSNDIAIDATTIIGNLKSNANETSWIEECINAISSDYWHTGNIMDYIQIVHDFSFKRKLIAFSKDMTREALKPDSVADELRNVATKRINEISKGINTDDMPSIDETASEVCEQVLSGIDETVIKTGYYDLDKKICGGLAPKKKLVLGARSSMGKSALALDIAYNIAVLQNIPVLFFSLEMSRQDLMKRLFSIDARVPQEKFSDGTLTDDDKNKIKESAKRISNSPLVLYDKGGLTAKEIRSVCKKYHSSHGIRIIIVDYLQYVTEPSGSGNRSREQAVANSMHELCETADELLVPIIILSQISRAVEGRKDKRPMMSDLRESGSIEQDADYIVLLYRDDYYDPSSADKGIAEANIAKARGGQTGVVKLSWIGEYTLFENLAFSETDDKPRPKKKSNDGFMDASLCDDIPFN